MRSSWVTEMRRSKLRENVGKGEAISKAKELHCIEAMSVTRVADVINTIDQDVWQKKIAEHFGHKWHAIALPIA